MFVCLAQCPATAEALTDWQGQFANGEQALKIQEYPAAEACFRQALKQVKHKGSSPDDVARCMQALAGTLQLQDITEGDGSIAFYKRALRLEKKAHGSDSPQLTPILVALGTIYEGEGSYRVAVKFYERALAITQKADGPQSLACALCQHRLGRVLFKLGSAQRAENLYLISLSNMMLQASLPSSLPLEELLSDYVDLLRKSDRPGVVASRFQDELLKDRLSSVERTRGVPASEWNKEVSGRLAAQAGLSLDEQKPFPKQSSSSSKQESETVLDRPVTDFAALDDLSRQRIIFYERMVAVDIDSLGPEHPSVARDLSGLASIYLLKNRFADAKPLLTRALNIYKKVYGPDSLLTRKTESLLELMNDEKKSVDDGGKSGREYLAGLPHIPLAAQKLEIALQLNYLALLCCSKGRIDDASRIYAWALADAAHACGEQSMLVSACLVDYGRVLRNSGRLTEADTMEHDAQIIMRHGLYKQEALALPQ
jgi:tetratricopeptide (TPR) repeat protein